MDRSRFTLPAAAWAAARAVAIVGLLAALLAAQDAPAALACGGPCPPPSPCFSIVLDNPSNANKASLCHFTGSAGNPFNLNEVGATAVNSHFDHHGDCYKFFDQDQVCIP